MKRYQFDPVCGMSADQGNGLQTVYQDLRLLIRPCIKIPTLRSNTSSADAKKGGNKACVGLDACSQERKR